jgi:hypothetical protein
MEDIIKEAIEARMNRIRIDTNIIEALRNGDIDQLNNHQGGPDMPRINFRIGLSTAIIVWAQTVYEHIPYNEFLKQKAMKMEFIDRMIEEFDVRFGYEGEIENFPHLFSKKDK